MKFTKMHGTGNDYIYVNCFEEEVKDAGRVSVYVSDRHFGIGSDGLILISPSDKADCRMSIFNADGSEALMCGNGIRCVGKYAWEHGIVDRLKRELTVDTLSGIKTLDLIVENDRVARVCVDMGPAKLTGPLTESIRVDGVSLRQGGSMKEELSFVSVNVGNPHAVFFVDENESLDLERIGPGFEYHTRFAPDRVNTEFIRVLDKGHISMRVWERGSGETLACGTGATASVYAAICMGLTDDRVDVSLKGGELTVCYDRQKNTMILAGPATEVFSGEISLPDFE